MNIRKTRKYIMRLSKKIVQRLERLERKQSQLRNRLAQCNGALDDLRRHCHHPSISGIFETHICGDCFAMLTVKMT